jgi:hypothetical protein
MDNQLWTISRIECMHSKKFAATEQ